MDIKVKTFGMLGFDEFDLLNLLRHQPPATSAPTMA